MGETSGCGGGVPIYSSTFGQMGINTMSIGVFKALP